MEQGMTGRPDDTRQLIRLRATDHGELDPLVVAPEKGCDVGLVGNRVDVHTGIAPSPVVDLGVEAVAATADGVVFTDGKERSVTQRRLLHRSLDDGLVVGLVVDGDDDPTDIRRDSSSCRGRMIATAQCDFSASSAAVDPSIAWA